MKPFSIIISSLFHYLPSISCGRRVKFSQTKYNTQVSANIVKLPYLTRIYTKPFTSNMSKVKEKRWTSRGSPLGKRPSLWKLHPFANLSATLNCQGFFTNQTICFDFSFLYGGKICKNFSFLAQTVFEKERQILVYSLSFICPYLWVLRVGCCSWLQAFRDQFRRYLWILCFVQGNNLWIIPPE